MRRLFLGMGFALCAVMALAKPEDSSSVDSLKSIRPVTSVFMVEGGASTLADTYLTPLFYDGWHAGFAYEHNQATAFSPANWLRRLSIKGLFDDTSNRVRNATMLNAEIEANFGFMRRLSLPVRGLKVGVGPAIDARAGVLYLSRNGNNPASAKGSVTVDAIGFASYHLKLWRLPITFRYQVDLPVVGACFSPDYGQLYYEIWLGERSGLVNPAIWGRYFRIDNLLVADLHLGSTTLRIGYHNDVISTKCHDIVSRRVTHAFTLGVVTEWISLNTRNSNSHEAQVFSAMY